MFREFIRSPLLYIRAYVSSKIQTYFRSDMASVTAGVAGEVHATLATKSHRY
jgi:hypothetical protein